MYKRTMILAAILVAAAVSSADLSAAPVTLQNPTATYSQTLADYWDGNVAYTLDGISNTGWSVAYLSESIWYSDPETAAFETVADAGYAGGTKLTFTLGFGQNWGDAFNEILGKFDLAVTTADRGLFADGLPTGGNVGDDSIWTSLTPLTAASALGATLTINPDNSVLASGLAPLGDTYTVTADTALTGITGIRLRVLADPSLPTDGPGRVAADSNFILTDFVVSQQAIPEPGTLALLASGLIGLVAYAWRKRK